MSLALRVIPLLLAVLLGSASLGFDGTATKRGLSTESAAGARQHSVEPVPLSALQDTLPEDGQYVFVRMRNKYYDSPIVVVHEGDTVVWVNETKGGWHDVQSFEGAFSSERMNWGDVFMHTFDEPGTHGYFCSPHVIDGMQGAVVVLPEGMPIPDPLPAPPPSPTVGSDPAPVEPGAPDTITTVAGGGGTGAAAIDASLYLPEGVALDDAGRLYVADKENCQIRRVDPGGTIVSILGHESCGASMGGDADLGPWLHTNHPTGVAVGPDGAVYVADTINCRIRRVEEGGAVSTVAGSGSCRASGDGGPASQAGLAPWDLSWDGSTLYVADAFNCRIRKIDDTGAITTVAGDGNCGFSGDGGLATEASLFFPRDVALDEDGVLYVADTGNCRVRSVDPATGTIETLTGGSSCEFSGAGGPADQATLHPWALAADRDGGLLVADRQNCRLLRLTPARTLDTIAGTGVCDASGDGGSAQRTELAYPGDVAVASDGSVYIADTGSCRIRRIDYGGSVATVAGSGVCAAGGDGGLAVAGGIWHPMGLVMGPQGDWYFSELDTCRVRKVDASGVVTAYAGTGVCGLSGDGGPATEAQLGDMLGGLALDAEGSLYVAEGYNCRVRRIDSDGVIDTFAGNGHCGFSGDGGPPAEASLDFVSDVALDREGNLHIAEPFNCRVRRVDRTSGTIETVVGDGSCNHNGEGVAAGEAGVEPWGVAIGPDGMLYLADSGNCRVRKVEPEGSVVTVAGGDACGYAGDGGPARRAELMRPYDLEVDREGTLYVADLRTFTIRKVDQQGIITTVAGIGISRPIDIGGFDPTNGVLCSVHNLPVPAPAYLGDGSAADQAGLYFPYGIALGHDGHLYIADTFDHRVRRVTCGGGVPCASPAAPIVSRSTETPGGGQTGRSGWKVLVLGLTAGIGATLLLAGAALARARARQPR